MSEPVTMLAFTDELQKIANHPSLTKTAFDPISSLGVGVGLNFVKRHAASNSVARRVAQEIAGVGYRTAQQGKPALSKATRGALSLFEPDAVGLYEKAHAVGQKMGPEQIRAIKALRSAFVSPSVESALKKDMPDLANAEKFLSGVPTESKGLRKVIDYGFTPIGQVGEDLKGLFKKKTPSAPAVALHAPVEAPASHREERKSLSRFAQPAAFLAAGAGAYQLGRRAGKKHTSPARAEADAPTPRQSVMEPPKRQSLLKVVR